MKHDVIADMPEHDAVSLLLPWYVNGTLGTSDRQRVDAHVPNCSSCRDSLEFERRIHAHVATDVVVEHIPVASLKRLHARLETRAPDTTRATREPRREHRLRPWLGLLAASVVGLVVTAALYTAHRWPGFDRGSSPAYYTVTDPEPRPANEVIRAVFVPSITLAELQSLLDEAQLRIISGPTEAGVYSLAARSSRPVGLSLALLRQHGSVRFAEITQEKPSKIKADGVP